MLQLRGFVGAPAKVKLVEFHPVQPWICYADLSDRLRVWDWTTQQTINDLQLGGPDDEGAMEAALNAMPARDPAFTTNPSAAAYVPSRVASGHIRQVRFLDAEVAYWQTAVAHAAVSGSASAPPSAVNVHALDGTRLLVVVCENKLLLYDMISRKPFEVGRAALDGRTPTCVAFLFQGGPQAPGGAPPPGSLMTSPVLAVGCSDGAVRLLHLATLRVIGRLAGNAKVSISSLLSLPSKAGFRSTAQQQAAAGANQQQQQQLAAKGGSRGGKQPSSRGGAPASAGGGGAAAAATAASAGGADAAATFVPSVDLLLGGDSAGGLFVWSPFAAGPLGSSEREMAPRLAFSGHGGEVGALCLAPGPEDAQHTAARVFSAGADGRLAAWDASSFQELWRLKLESKAPVTSLAFSQRYFGLSGAHGLLATVNGSAVVAVYSLAELPPEKGIRTCANLAGLVPPGSKKVPKAYVVAASPVRPNLAAVGANTGLAFLTFDRMYPLPVAGLPLLNLAEAHDSPATRVPRERAAASYVAHLGDAVWLVAATAVERDLGQGVTQLVPQVLSSERLGPAVGRTGRAIVGVSGAGDYVSVCWPASRAYVVYYRTLAGTWQQVEAGSGVDVAWHSQRPLFAVLDEPPPPPLPAAGKGRRKRGGKEDAARAAAAEAAAVAAAMAASTVVRIRALDGLGCSTVCPQVALAGDVPCGLHGGPLLGVALKRLTATGSELSGEDASPVLQFYSWNGATKVGPELPEPPVLAWDPSLRYLAAAYLRQVVVFRAQPRLEPLGSLPITGTTGMAWGLRQLYLATPTSVLLAFVAADEVQQQQQPPSSTPLPGAAGGLDLLDGPLLELSSGLEQGQPGSGGSTLQFIQLAALTGTSATSSLRAGCSGRDASLPGPCARPPGPIALIGPRQGNLWLVNSLGQPMLLPLTHPGIRARCLCAQGDLVGAVAVGRHGLDASQHDSLAAFLALQAGVPGAHLSLMGLQGLSLAMEAELAMMTGQWRRACVCCEALMRGCTTRVAALGGGGGGPEAQQGGGGTAPPGGDLLAAMGVTAPLATPGQLAQAAAVAGAGVDLPDAPASKQQQQMWGLMGFGGLFVDNFQLPPDAADAANPGAEDPLAKGRLAWAAPLSHDWALGSAPRQVVVSRADGGGGAASWLPGGGAAAGLVTAATAVAAAAQPPPASALSLAMRLVEGSQAAGITDVTRRASQLLLAYRGLLSPQQLARLAAHMAEAGMAPELRELVESGVACGQHAGQAVAFVAAALTGDLELLQGALRQSGSSPLAALQANSFRLPTSALGTEAWNASLRAVGADLAAHQTSSFAYYTVAQSALV